MYTINREFNHRTFGKIGAAQLTIDAPAKGKIVATLDGKELGDDSIEYLLNFALQSLQDAYAGAKTETDATVAFDKKRAAIIEGTVGMRGGGAGEEAHMPYVRQVIRKNLGADNKAKYDAIASDDQAARKEFLNGLFAGLADDKQAKVLAVANDLLAAAREAAKKAKGTDDLGL